MTRVFSSEVDRCAGSREENASKQKQAVAEVMGVAFVRRPKEGKTETKRVASSPAPLGDFVIHVDDAFMLIVEITKKNTLAFFDRSKSWAGARPNSRTRY
jgi:hypothetical protein